MSDEKITEEGGQSGVDLTPGELHVESAGGDVSGDLPPGFTIEEVPEKKGGGCLRIFLLLLLLVVAAGAGLIYYASEMLAPEPVAVQQERTPPGKMKVPERAPTPTRQEPVEEEVISKDKVATVPVKKEAPAKAPEPKVAEPKKEVPPAFALSSGSYLYQGRLKKALKQIEKMGYEVKRTEKPEPHEMTRLLVGRYERQMAQKRLSEVSEYADGAFLAAEEGKLAVYAGSFISLDKARRAADILYQKGIRVDEMQVTIDIPKTTLVFGGFATEEDALKVAKSLEKNGVKDPKVIKLK